MPCDTITTQSVNLANAIPDVLAAALTGDGWTLGERTATAITARNAAGEVLSWTRGGRLSISTRNRQEDRAAAVARQYSRAAVTWAAQRAGWKVQQAQNGKLTVTR